jgi:hypothetical protein
VNAIETGAEAITAVVFHSFHLLLISVDTKGYVRVNNGADGNLLNAFHVSNGTCQHSYKQARLCMLAHLYVEHDHVSVT